MLGRLITPQALALAALTVSRCAAQMIQDLSSLDWTVSSPLLNISIPGSFPSQAHLDLYAAQVIGDPLYGLNDFNLRWVAWSNWTYSALLPLSPNEYGCGVSPSSNRTNASSTASNQPTTYLLFQGLDTFTTINLCGQQVATTNNQFRQYYFDISSILSTCKGLPHLSINFGSAPSIAGQLAIEPNAQKWPQGVEQIYEFENRQYIRKEQSDFGWDWGPAMAPAGPWLPAYIVQLNNQQVEPRNTLIDIYKVGQRNNLPPDQSQPWVVNASIDYLGTLPSGASLAYLLKDASNKTISQGKLNNVTSSNGTITGNTMIGNDMVNLWWPTGLGPQTLYNMTVSIVGGKSNSTLATVQKHVGFRTIVLNEGNVTQEQLAKGVAPGNNFHFEINGEEFYAKGSNFIPPDAFWPRVTEDRISKLFDSVVAGNQNMLRVWASGAYSPDFLYDLADEMGILLWCEFEFGDALYPADKAFLDNVFEEVNYQVRRVNHHPSMAYWAGGNELENLELSTVNLTAPDKYLYYKGQYETLFLDTIVPALFDNSRSISYSPSSTSNGYISLNFTEAPYFQERYLNLANGSIYGDTDYYNYNTTLAFDYSEYPIGRFANEFGFHSMPSIQTWRQAVPESQLQFNSSTVMLRNHHFPAGGLSTDNFYNSSLGMGEMTIAVELWYPTPNKTDSIANFTAWCLSTQIFQADYYASQIQFYRRASGFPQRQLGSLYWQLEDIWQAPTWAGIEYDGRWKMLHYRAKDVYSNVIVSPFYNSSSSDLEVYVTSDLWDTANGTASLKWYTWSGEALTQIRGLDSAPFTVGGLNTTRVFTGNLTQLLGSTYKPADVVMQLSVNASGKLPNSNSNQTQSFTHTNWFHAERLSKANLVDPGLTISHNATAKQFTVLAANGVAAWVWLDYPAGANVQFQDNAFWLPKGQNRSIGYKVVSDTTNGAWADGVVVSSIYNNTLPN